jgi:hypothetical protein
MSRLYFYPFISQLFLCAHFSLNCIQKKRKMRTSLSSFVTKQPMKIYRSSTIEEYNRYRTLSITNMRDIGW